MTLLQFVLHIMSSTVKMEESKSTPSGSGTILNAAHRFKKTQPPEAIVTEGDLQLKQLAKKQIETQVTLESELSRVKNFAQGTVFAEPLEGLTGQVTLGEFKRKMEEMQSIDELRRCGLTEDEITFQLQRSGSSVQLNARTLPKHNYGVDPLADEDLVKSIEQKIEVKERELLQPTTFAGARPLTRHEMELEQAVTRDRDPTKVFRCLLTNRPKDPVTLDPDHPINHLDEIWKGVVSSIPTCSRRKRNRKGAEGEIMEDGERPMETNEKDKEFEISANHEADFLKRDEVTASKSKKRRQRRDRQVLQEKKAEVLKVCTKSVDNSDKQQLVPRTMDVCSSDSESNHAGAQTPSDGTKRSKNWRRKRKHAAAAAAKRAIESVADIKLPKHFNCDAVWIPVEVIERFRLTVDQIKELPRFQDYTPGVPSPTLFVKNLSPSVIEDDLVSLFGRFQVSCAAAIDFKLLHGRMKGCAFVTFDSAETAQSAMNLVNGYDFKGKPIIIVFGRTKTLNESQDCATAAMMTNK